MTELPKPLRYVVEVRGQRTIDVHTDQDVADFLALLAPVRLVEPLNRPLFRVHLDERYTYDEQSVKQTQQWVLEQLAVEYGATDAPGRVQAD